MSLRDALRAGTDEEEMLEIIGGAVKRKKKHHAGNVALSFNSHASLVLRKLEVFLPGFPVPHPPMLGLVVILFL